MNLIPIMASARIGVGGLGLVPLTLHEMVGPPGLEPGTCGLRVRCSAKLSYRPRDFQEGE